MAKYRINYKQQGKCEIYNTDLGRYVTIDCDKVPQRVRQAVGTNKAFTVEPAKRLTVVGRQNADDATLPPVTVVNLPEGGKEVETPALPGEPTGEEGFNIFGYNISGTTIAIILALLALLGVIIYMVI